MGAQPLEEQANMRVNKDNPYVFIQDENAASEVGFIPDYHDDPASLEALASQMYDRNQGKRKIIILGDPTDKKELQRFRQQYGFADPQQIQMETITHKVLQNDQEREAFQVVMAINQYGGLDNYLSLVSQQQPGTNIEQQKEMLSQYFEQYKSLGIEDKLQNVDPAILRDMQKSVQEAVIGMQALDLAFEEYYSTNIAHVIDKINKEYNNEFDIILDGGNHGTSITSHLVKEKVEELLKNRDVSEDDVLRYTHIYDLNEVGGTIKLGKGKDEYRFQAASNVYGMVHPSDSQIYGEEQLAQLYPHMYGNKMAGESIHKESAEDIATKAMQDMEYKRMRANASEDEKLHNLFLHSSVGAPAGYGGKSHYGKIDSYGVKYTLDNHVIGHEQYNGKPLQIAGHIHHTREELDEEYGVYKIERPMSISGVKDGEFYHIEVDHKKEKPIVNDQEVMELYKKKKEELMELYKANEKRLDNYQQAA